MPARPPRTMGQPGNIIYFMLRYYPTSPPSRQRVARTVLSGIGWDLIGSAWRATLGSTCERQPTTVGVSR